MRRLAIVLVLSLAAFAQTSPEAQAIAREQRLLHEEEQQDVAAVRAEVATDALLIDANGAVYTTDLLLRAVAAARPSFRTPENTVARALGADAWIVSFEFQVPNPQPGRVRRFRVSSLWKLDGSTWKLAWRQSTPISVPQQR